MPDIARNLKRVREELSRFQETIRTKMLEREKLQQEIEKMGQEIQQIRTLEREIILKRSLLGRLDMDLTRLSMQKKRLEREIPALEYELGKMERERRFGRQASV